MIIDETVLQTYLQERFHPTLKLLSLRPLNAADNKEGNFTAAYFATIQQADQQPQEIVVKRVVAAGFGLEDPWDRARHMLWCYQAYTELPRHPNALDVGCIQSDGTWCSLADSQDYFLIEEFVAGEGYYLTFDSILADKALTSLDRERCQTLAHYLAALHQEKKVDAVRYQRALREVIGSGEGIMGLIDAFPAPFKQRHFDLLLNLQQACLARVWHLSQLDRPICLTHGDFHPWNILFRQGTDFSVIDRSRASWNDPAVDVGSMLMNYLFLGLREADFEQSCGLELAALFLDTYLDASQDEAILTTLGPHLAMRSTAVASPIFYPALPETLRLQLFNLALDVSQKPRLPRDIRQWLV